MLKMSEMMLNEHVNMYVDHHWDQLFVVAVVVKDMVNHYCYDMHPWEVSEDR